MTKEDEYRDKRVDEIEARLNAVEEVRPGEFGAVIGSGHNQCTAIVAELIGPRVDGEDNEIEKPEACPYWLIKYPHCSAPPPLRQTFCGRFKIPRDCPLESRIDTCFVCDCLPDWILKDDPDIPDHIPILKLLEKIKPDLRFLIGEVKKLTVERDQAREITCQSCDYLDYDGELSSKYCGAPTDHDCPLDAREKLKELRKVVVNLVDFIESEDANFGSSEAMGISRSREFADAKKAIEAESDD